MGRACFKLSKSQEQLELHKCLSLTTQNHDLNIGTHFEHTCLQCGVAELTRTNKFSRMTRPRQHRPLSNTEVTLNCLQNSICARNAERYGPRILIHLSTICDSRSCLSMVAPPSVQHQRSLYVPTSSSNLRQWPAIKHFTQQAAIMSQSLTNLMQR